MKTNNLFSVLIVALLFLALYAKMQQSNKSFDAPYKLNNVLLYSIKHKELVSLPQNEKYILCIMASWCKYCKQNVTKLMQLRDITGLKVIGILWNDQDFESSDWVSSVKEEYDDILLYEAKLDLDISSIPMTFFVDENGTIAHHYSGLISEGQINEFKQDQGL